MEGEMLKRLSRQSIASFVMCGSETLEFEDGNFDERLRLGENLVEEYLNSLRLTEDEKDELTYRNGKLLDLYFEQGIKMGTLLVKNLTE